MTRRELEDIYLKCKKLRKIALKIWKKKHYKWGNDINYEAITIQKMIEAYIGQQE